jgi:transposase
VPDNRLFVDAILCRYRTSVPWRDLPERYAHWKTAHRRYRRRCESGVFARVIELLAHGSANELMMLNATIVRAHQHSASAQKSWRRPCHRSLVGEPDDQNPRRRRPLGNPDALTRPGQAADITQAEPLIERTKPGALLANKGYDSYALVAALDAREITAVITSKANRKRQRKTDFALYRQRNFVERLCCTLEQFRAIATRYNKLVNTFMAGVLLEYVV